jgi:cell division septation protein DedD
MTDLIAAFRQEFDLVIFDCSPILPVTDAAILASKMDGTLIVYRVGRTARVALKRAKALLESVRGKVLGIVLTGVRAEVSPDYEELEYYRYAYGQEPGHRASERLASQGRQSLLRRVASFLMSVSLPTRAIVLVVLGLLALGALAWWFGLWPTSWLRSLAPRADQARAAPQVLNEERRSASVPIPGVEVASAAPVMPPPPPPEPTTRASSAPGSPVSPAPPGRAGPDPPEPVHPFSLQVASRPDRAVPMAFAEALRKKGLEAFTVPAQIPGKGVWYRVLIGGFDSAARAAEMGNDLRTKGLIGEALVVRLPYAVDVDVAPGDQAANTVALARRSGYLPVLHSDSGNPSAGSTQILRVDAFRTDEEAKHLADILRAAGLSPRVIRR